jgi:hypothetical protein
MPARERGYRTPTTKQGKRQQKAFWVFFTGKRLKNRSQSQSDQLHPKSDWQFVATKPVLLKDVNQYFIDVRVT